MNRTFVQFSPRGAAGLIACALWAGCAHGDQPPPVAAAAADYHLQREDVVDVQVWKEPALSAAAPVRPDGKITVPMVGEVAAEGRTARELQDEIAERLRPFVPAPAVTVIVREVKAGRFFVLGEVTHPGAYPIAHGLTVLEAMALAGGPTEFARTSRMLLMRPQGAGRSPSRIRVSLGDIVSGRLPPVQLLAGDTLYVP